MIRHHEWTVHGSLHLAVLTKIHCSNTFKNCKYHKVYIVSMVMHGKIVKLSLVCQFNYSYPGFHFCFQFFRSVDLDEITKRCLHALALNLSYMWVWSLLIYLGLFSLSMCSKVCEEVGAQSVETVKLRFFVSFSG